MSATTSQLMLRHTRLIARQTTLRHASTTSEVAEAVSSAASKSKETASNLTSKASDGLSRVKSSAGPAISGAAQRVNGVLSRIGGRTGRLIAFGQSLIPPTIYYSKVGFELSKLVFQGQKMNPPSIEAFKSYFSPFIHLLRHPRSFFNAAEKNANSITAHDVLTRIRNVDRPQLVSMGVIAAEVLGFFTVGEIIGRRKIVGYRGDVEQGGHH